MPNPFHDLVVKVAGGDCARVDEADGSEKLGHAMFVDPGIGLMVAQHLNRWLRRQRRPRGEPDYYYRGIRLSYNRTYRAVMCCFSALMFGAAFLLYFVPGLMDHRSAWWELLLKLAWFGITGVAILVPLQAFREFAVVSDEGVLKCSLFGDLTHLDWGEIQGVQTKPGENEISLIGEAKKRLKLSLCYNGWQDFLEYGARHLSPPVRFGVMRALAEPAPQKARSARKRKRWRIGLGGSAERGRLSSWAVAWIWTAVVPLGFSAQTGEVARPGVIYTFDARPLNRLDLHVPANAAKLWDTLHTLAGLQGLANRKAPQLYLFYCSEFGVDTDQFWFDWYRGEDGWLKDCQVRQLASLEEAIRTFQPLFKGVVVYDPKAPATSNLASTAAGCEDLLPVRFDASPGSVFELVVRRMKLPVKLWLVNEDGTPKFTGKGTVPDSQAPTSGSAKIDAYRWARQRYLRPGGCAPGMAAYYLDAYWLRHPGGNPTLHTLSNHDYFVARRAFFFDLSPWGDEAPGDDPEQTPGLDRNELLAVMRGLYDQARGGVICVGGFTPWPYKYTTHSRPPGKHEGVPTEWEYGRLISQFNGYMEADAAGLSAMANASFHQHYPLARRYAQPNPKPGLAQWRARGYVTPTGKVANKLFVGHYVGDYDAPSWLYKAVPAFFRDPARGRVPLGWAFDPNLADRAPQALVYAYRHATTNDFFIAGDSGAGYLNPRALTVRPDSELPSGLRVWTEHCRRYYERWGMSITGFILDGSGGRSTDLEFGAYRSFASDGAGTHFEEKPAVLAGLPTCREQDLPDDVERAADAILEAARQRPNKPGFVWARSILKRPAWYAELSEILARKRPNGEIAVVDPYTFFGLIRLQTAQ